MESMWYTILFVLKWILVALIYLVLWMVLRSVYQEMRRRVTNVEILPPVSGGLKVQEPGDDPHVRIGAVLPLKPETHIGYSKDNDLQLGDQKISGHHALIRWDGATWWITDLASTNGVLINNHPCPPNREVMLQRGATIQLGAMVFQLVA